MATKYIKKIKLPGQTEAYSVYDEEAIHSIEELGLGSALVFKGTKETVAEVLAITSAKQGDVWLVTADNSEYVCKQTISAATESAWEKLGYPIDAASSKHTHTVTVTGTNKSSSVSGTVNVPKVSNTSKYMKATATQGAVTPTKDNVLGESTVFTTTVTTTPTISKIKATASDVAVGANGTVNAITALGTPTTSSAITGFGAHTTDSVLGSGTTFNVTGGTPTTTNIKATASGTALSTGNADFVKSYPGATSKLVTTSITPVGGTASVPGSVSATAGSAASWSATVDANGVLSFSWKANTPTSVTVGANKTVATAGTATTVATGSLSTSATGGQVMTGLGKATTGKALTSASVSTQPTIALSTGATAGTGVVSVVTDVSGVSVSANNDDAVSAITALGTPTTTNAITGFGTHTMKAVLTGVKVTTQPTITLAVDSNATTGAVDVVTGVSSTGSTTASGDVVSALTGVTVGNPTVSLASDTTTGTGKVSYVDSVTVGSEDKTFTGTAAAQTWTQKTGVTGQPQ